MFFEEHAVVILTLSTVAAVAVIALSQAYEAYLNRD